MLMCSVLALVCIQSLTATYLDEYIREHDGCFEYHLIKKGRSYKADVYIMNMTSQCWGKGYVVKHTLWWHYVRVVVPDVIKHPETAIVIADTGKNDESVDSPGMFFFNSGEDAAKVGSVVSYIQAIPNSPLTFMDDPESRARADDAELAWSFTSYLKNTSDPSKLLLLPMTKACVKAMDMTTEFVKKLNGNDISKFIVSGVSKKSWASWLSAAVDKRVVGLIAVVYDFLNLKKGLDRMLQLYGGWSFGMRSYYLANATTYLQSAAGLKMEALADPYSYRDRLTMPKLMIQATADEFTPLDNSHIYFDDIPGPKYLHMIANADHVLIGHMSKVRKTFSAFAIQLMSKGHLPVMNWTTEIKGDRMKLVLQVDNVLEINSVRVHHAHIHTKRRDFRFLVANPRDPLHKISLNYVAWFSKKANKEGDDIYWTEFTYPKKGFVGFYMMVDYKGHDGVHLELSSKTYVIPDKLPFPPCKPTNCTPTLV